ncbi:MAG: hypothetical protein U0936_05710 [Planctomycetaceae bacterium]
MAIVRLPADFLNDSHDVVACVRRRLAELEPVIDLDVSDFDSKAKIDSCEVISVQTSENAIEICYELKFSASYTCTDIEFAGTHQRILRGVRDGDFWVFESCPSFESRSTVDEF